MLLSLVFIGTTLTQSGNQLVNQTKLNFVQNSTKLFRGIELSVLDLYADSLQESSFESILIEEPGLNWTAAKLVTPERGIVYWLRTQLVGNDQFRGKQIFHLGQEMGNDLHAYDHIDIYTKNQKGKTNHIKTGRLVKKEDKPIAFWLNLIPLDIQEQDTVDVYIRLEGFNLNYPLQRFKLWHLDYQYLFSRQLSATTKSSVFYGILGIQILFFVFLYLIEKERIYVYFSIFGLGFFLSRAFSEFNFSSLVPFPSLIPYNEMIYHSSVYINVLGGVLFVSKYLNMPRDGWFMKRIVPMYLIMTLIAYLRFMFRYSFSDEGTYPTLLTPAFYTFSALLLGIYMIIKAPTSKATSRRLLLIAIIPIIIGSALTIFFNEGWLPTYFNAMLIDDIMKIAVVLFLVTLALIVGYRSNLLKAEKNEVIQENLKAQQTIFEKQLRTEKLEELDQLKTKLYTNITHEFRTPLTVILGVNNELLETSKALNIPESKKEAFFHNQHLIQRNSENLLTLVNQLLDLSKADNQELSLDFIQGDILPFLNYLTESFFSKAKEKNIRLVFYTELDSLVMDYDEQQMQHIIYNLLSNALKFTEGNGKIVVHASILGTEAKHHLQLKVSDNGIGIAPEKLPYIFDRFYQVDDSHTRQNDGSGIGLSLTKEIINFMDGEITVKSKKGEGTVFTVRLPITNNATSQTEPRFLPKVNQIEIQSLTDSKQNQSSILNNDLNPSENKPRILIVEDNNDVSDYLKQILLTTYHISQASNGELGISKAFDIVPDLIICDVMMPIKDGYELTQILKEDTRTSHIPIILLTAKATQVDKLQGLKQGADAYLYKPFNKEELLIRVERLLANREALRHFYISTFSGDLSENRPQSVHREEKEEQFLLQLKQFIEDDLQNERLNAAYLSAKIGVSQSQLYKKLKALIGETPNTLIRNIRLQKSLTLLQDTELNISEIAYELGFSNPSYFSKSFHKKYGKSPIVFRKDS